MILFDEQKETPMPSFFIDERLHPEEVQFVVFLLDEAAEKIVLTQQQPFVNFGSYTFSIVFEHLYLNGTPLSLGRQVASGKNLLVLSAKEAETTFFTYNKGETFVIGQESSCGLQIKSPVRLFLQETQCLIFPNEEWVFANKKKITENTAIPIQDGLRLLTKDFQLMKRKTQWAWRSFFGESVQPHPTQCFLTTRKETYPPSFPNYRRSPRLHLEVQKSSFQLDVLPQEAKGSKGELARLLVPPFGMFAMTGLTAVLSGGNPLMSLGMGGMSLLTSGFSLSQFLSDKKENALQTQQTKEAYTTYLVELMGKIVRAYREEQTILAFQQPTPQQLAILLLAYDARIYERQRQNKDFLTVSLGLGEIASQLKIETNVDVKDFRAQASHLRHLQETYQTQREAPILLQLMGQTVGMIGTEETWTQTLQSLLFQVAFFHSYQDVQFLGLFSKEAYQKTWKAWRFLPHFRLEAFHLRGLIATERQRDIVLNAFYQLLQKRKTLLKESGREKPLFTPHYVLVIADDRLLSGHGLNELLAEDMRALGVSVIWCKENEALLPETVTALIHLHSAQSAQLKNDHQVYVNQAFRPYALPKNIEVCVRTLANVTHVEVEKQAVPESLSLLEQYEVDTVEALDIAGRWAKAEPNKSIRSLIGWRGKKDKSYWDLHERAHGPHALVGGTTGSGKSEFLTTYLLGLAINFSPEDIGLLVIDWKGGGIANILEDLPHFMGAITNLDGAGTTRALASIKAELQKRQREFARYGVNNINGYMSLYKSRHTPKEGVHYPTVPLPHLMLVSDEFAELKANVPEFLDELTSVARIGRSLGVHLILATQKPSGVVNDQIEANATSKIALKMASVQDSNELLKTGDAAQITSPGRGYLKVGQNEVYELFQSGYAGVPYIPENKQEESKDERLYKINALGQYELLYDPNEEVVQGQDTSDFPTQLEAVIQTIRQVFQEASYALPEKPWLPNLGEKLVCTETETGASLLAVPFGLLDLPKKQAQAPYFFDLTQEGHTALFGSSGFGKSTLIQTFLLTLAKQCTPEEVTFSLMDFGNNGLLPLKDLPNVADIVSLEEEEKLEKMLAQIRQELGHRKQLFKQVGVSSLAQHTHKTKEQLPFSIVVLDHYDGLTSEHPNKEAVDQTLLQLLRDGSSLGIYLFLTALRTGTVRMNMMSGFSSKLCLYLNDESDVRELMGRESLPQEMKAGRGQVHLEEPLAIQFYLPVQGASSTELLLGLEQEVARLNREWTGSRPKKIPMVPEKLSVAGFEELFPEKEANTLYLGMDKQQAIPLKMPLFQGETLGLFFSGKKQLVELSQDWLSWQLATIEATGIVFDSWGHLQDLPVDLLVSKEQLARQGEDILTSLKALRTASKEKKYLLVFHGFTQILEKIGLSSHDFFQLMEEIKEVAQYILMDVTNNVGNSYNQVTKDTGENVTYLLFGGEVGAQNFVDVAYPLRQLKLPLQEMMCLQDEELLPVVLPKKEGEEDDE